MSTILNADGGDPEDDKIFKIPTEMINGLQHSEKNQNCRGFDHTKSAWCEIFIRILNSKTTVKKPQ